MHNQVQQTFFVGEFFKKLMNTKYINACQNSSFFFAYASTNLLVADIDFCYSVLYKKFVNIQ